MEDWILGEFEHSLIITEQGSRTCMGNMHIRKHTSKPNCLTRCLNCSPILCFCRGESHCLLLLTSPCDSTGSQSKHIVGIYRVSSSNRVPKDTAHKQITDQYTSIVHVVKPSKRETVHALSQRGHFRQFINKRIKIYISFSHEWLPYK